MFIKTYLIDCDWRGVSKQKVTIVVVDFFQDNLRQKPENGFLNTVINNNVLINLTWEYNFSLLSNVFPTNVSYK